MAPQPRRGQIWTLAGLPHRRVVIYSGNMLNEIPDEHIITMDVVDAPATLSVALAREGYVRYTWLRHRPRDELGEQVGEVDDELMSKVNTQLFMVISTN